MKENWVDDVISKWKSEGVKLNPPATMAEIENVEAILNFKFPADFKEFYLQVNGFKDFDMQEHLFTLWPLEEIIQTFKYRQETNFVGFADFLANSHSSGYSKNWPGIFNDFLHVNTEIIAQSFKEFITKMNSGERGLY